MADESKKKLPQDSRPEYEPPRATRLSDFQTGSGGTLPVIVCNPGTGVTAECIPGTNATSGCFGSGNSANLTCSTSGNNVLT